MPEALLIKEFTVALAMVCRVTVLMESMAVMVLAAFQCIIKTKESQLTCLSITEEEGAPETLNL